MNPESLIAPVANAIPAANGNQSMLEMLLQLLMRIVDVTKDRPEILLAVVVVWSVSWLAAWWVWFNRNVSSSEFKAQLSELAEDQSKLQQTLQSAQDRRETQFEKLDGLVEKLGDRLDALSDRYADKTSTEGRFASLERGVLHFTEEATTLVHNINEMQRRIKGEVE